MCVDRRNKLNDLTGKEWLVGTKSYFFQKGLGAKSKDAEIERLHPAPFSFQNIMRLVLFFTKKGGSVLDPFGGVGSTAKACELTGRICTSVELSPKWHGLAIVRLEKECGEGASHRHVFINGDSSVVLRDFPDGNFDFVVTSPPYWGILDKRDQKVKKNRIVQNLDTKYSDDDRDLGNIDDYLSFLGKLVEGFLLPCGRVLKPKGYMAVIVSDFRDKSRFISFHSDLIGRLDNALLADGRRLSLKGTKVLLQDHKSLHPYGYPFAYVENIHHQYVLIFRKE